MLSRKAGTSNMGGLRASMTTSVFVIPELVSLEQGGILDGLRELEL